MKTEIKNSLEGISIFERAGKRIRKLDETEIIQSEDRKEKRMKESGQRLVDLWDTLKGIDILGSPRRRGEGKRTEKYLKK